MPSRSIIETLNSVPVRRSRGSKEPAAKQTKASSSSKVERQGRSDRNERTGRQDKNSDNKDRRKQTSSQLLERLYRLQQEHDELSEEESDSPRPVHRATSRTRRRKDHTESETESDYESDYRGKQTKQTRGRRGNRKSKYESESEHSSSTSSDDEEHYRRTGKNRRYDSEEEEETYRKPKSKSNYQKLSKISKRQESDEEDYENSRYERSFEPIGRNDDRKQRSQRHESSSSSSKYDQRPKEIKNVRKSPVRGQKDVETQKDVSSIQERLNKLKLNLDKERNTRDQKQEQPKQQSKQQVREQSEDEEDVEIENSETRDFSENNRNEQEDDVLEVTDEPVGTKVSQEPEQTSVETDEKQDEKQSENQNSDNENVEETTSSKQTDSSIQKCFVNLPKAHIANMAKDLKIKIAKEVPDFIKSYSGVFINKILKQASEKSKLITSRELYPVIQQHIGLVQDLDKTNLNITTFAKYVKAVAELYGAEINTDGVLYFHNAFENALLNVLINAQSIMIRSKHKILTTDDLRLASPRNPDHEDSNDQ